MPMVGFVIEKINAEKTAKKIKGNINVKTNIKIKNIEKQEIQVGEKKETILDFCFDFKVDYQPNIGKIEIVSHILYTDKPKVLEATLKEWKKKKKIDQQLMTRLYNIILYRCSIKALALSQEVNLPPSLRLPTIKPPKPGAVNYIG